MSTMSPTGPRLREIATFIRSKNAGPFILTIDIFFDNGERCLHVLNSEVLSARVIATLYDVAPQDVRIMHVEQAHAVKISFPRPLPAGDIGERDVAGGQQFAPLLDLVVPTR